MLHFSLYVIVREMSRILDMAALGAADGPVDAALNLRSALKPLIRDNDVEFEGMCRCLVEMLAPVPRLGTTSTERPSPTSSRSRPACGRAATSRVST